MRKFILALAMLAAPAMAQTSTEVPFVVEGYDTSIAGLEAAIAKRCRDEFCAKEQRDGRAIVQGQWMTGSDKTREYLAALIENSTEDGVTNWHAINVAMRAKAIELTGGLMGGTDRRPGTVVCKTFPYGGNIKTICN